MPDAAFFHGLPDDYRFAVPAAAPDDVFSSSAVRCFVGLLRRQVIISQSRLRGRCCSHAL